MIKRDYRQKDEKRKEGRNAKKKGDSQTAVEWSGVIEGCKHEGRTTRQDRDAFNQI